MLSNADCSSQDTKLELRVAILTLMNHTRILQSMMNAIQQRFWSYHENELIKLITSYDYTQPPFMRVQSRHLPFTLSKDIIQMKIRLGQSGKEIVLLNPFSWQGQKLWLRLEFIILVGELWNASLAQVFTVLHYPYGKVLLLSNYYPTTIITHDIWNTKLDTLWL